MCGDQRVHRNAAADRVGQSPFDLPLIEAEDDDFDAVFAPAIPLISGMTPSPGCTNNLTGASL